MPRSKKHALEQILEPIAQRFANEIAAAVMDLVEQRVKQETERLVGRALEGVRAKGRPAVAARPSGVRVCRVPGCGKPSKGPRFDYFCEEHRNLPEAEKEAIKQKAKEAEAR